MKYTELYDLNFLEHFDSKGYDILDDLELDVPNDYQIKVEEIINSFNIKVKKSKTMEDNKSGCYDSRDNVIYVNSSEIEQRQKFTLAHEFGHYILKKQNDVISNRLSSMDDYLTFEEKINEREVNSFASELLMPKKLVEMALKKIDDNDERSIIHEISRRMNLSRSFVNFRLYNLKYVGKIYYGR